MNEKPEQDNVVFRSKPVLIFSILLNLILYVLVLPVYKTGILKYPLVFVFTALTFFLPLVYAWTKKIVLSDQGLRIVVFWGLFNDEYKWQEIIEGRYILQENYGKFTPTNLPVTGWLESMIAPRTIQLILANGDSLVFNMKSVIHSKDFYCLLKKRVRFIR